MRSINAGIRAKRFEIKHDKVLNLVVETSTGSQLKLKVINASLTGLGAVHVGPIPNSDLLTLGSIVPESKLLWEDHEFPLGRMVLRSLNESSDTETRLGFSCVDAKIPMLGTLSHYFEQLARGEEHALAFELSSKKYNIATFMESEHSHNDLFEKCRQYELLWADCQKNPMYQYYSVRHESKWPRVNLKLTRTKKRSEYLAFCTYDYLGLATHPAVAEAAKSAIDKYGVSPGGSLTLCGKTSLHEELEATVARMLGKEDVILFNAGFAANSGAITALLGANDLVVADLYSHASIQDAIFSSKGKARLFRHGVHKHMDSLLNEHRGSFAGGLAITEGLFSMDGDVPDLKAFVETAQKHNCRTYVDEAHSFGLLGETGLGACEREGVLEDIDIYMGTFSKALGCGGGFIAGNKALIQWLRSFARAGMFSGGLHPSTCAAALKSLEIARLEIDRRRKIKSNVKLFRTGLERLGFKLQSDPESPIVPVVIGDQEKIGLMNQVLLDRGIFVNPVIYPAVPVNAARFRFSLSANHSHSDIELALAALEKALSETGWQPELLQKKG